MLTHFVTTEVDLQATPIKLQQAIEAELKKQGEPLRWAITSVDVERQKAFVEAIITVGATQTSRLGVRSAECGVRSWHSTHHSPLLFNSEPRTPNFLS